MAPLSPCVFLTFPRVFPPKENVHQPIGCKMPTFMLCARWKSGASSSACGPPRRTLSRGSEATEVTIPEWSEAVCRSAATQKVPHQSVLPESARARVDCGGPPFPLVVSSPFPVCFPPKVTVQQPIGCNCQHLCFARDGSPGPHQVPAGRPAAPYRGVAKPRR